MIYGSIPAGGKGTRLQPLGFSKELAPVGGRAVIEHLIARMVEAGVEKIFINTASDKTDLITYLSTKSEFKNNLIFMVRDRKGLLDGIVSPAEYLRDDDQLIFGLPDTLWTPHNSFSQIIDFKASSDIVLGLFDSGHPEKYDSVVIDKSGRVESVDVKVKNPKTKWTWGIGRISVSCVGDLLRINENQKDSEKLFGVTVDSYAREHDCYAVELENSSYLDIGTPDDYERAKDFIKNYK